MPDHCGERTAVDRLDHSSDQGNGDRDTAVRECCRLSAISSHFGSSVFAM